MHVDVFIHQKGGDRSPGSFSEGTSVSPSSPCGSSSASHTQRCSRDLLPASLQGPFPSLLFTPGVPGPEDLPSLPGSV